VDPPLVGTGPFQRMVEGREFKLNAMPKGDIYPPNRVTDLQATAWPQYDRITLRWTSPGGDYKIGQGEQSARFEREERSLSTFFFSTSRMVQFLAKLLNY
jgi:hypothetical protein